MKHPPKISDAEWDVMKVVWRGHPVSAQGVMETLAGDREWSASTVKTLLGRLVKKRALRFERDGRQFLYEPLVTQEDCQRAEAKFFLARVFDGALTPMMAHFVESEKLSAADAAEIERILKRKKS